MPGPHVPIDIDGPHAPRRRSLLRALGVLLLWCLAIGATAILPPIVARWLITLHLIPL